MIEVKVYNREGEATGALKLSEKVFGLGWNPDLVQQIVESARANRRAGTAHAKDRGEVSGGGRKPWRQKGTGRARHGSIRSPLWRGGGVTHGPTNKKNNTKKMKRKAMLVTLSQKLRDQEVLFVESVHIPEAKTKNGAEMLKNLSRIDQFQPLASSARVMVVTPEADRAALRAFRNIKNVEVREARNLNTSEMLQSKFMIIPKTAVETIEKTFA